MLQYENNQRISHVTQRDKIRLPFQPLFFFYVEHPLSRCYRQIRNIVYPYIIARLFTAIEISGCLNYQYRDHRDNVNHSTVSKGKGTPITSHAINDNQSVKKAVAIHAVSVQYLTRSCHTYLHRNRAEGGTPFAARKEGTRKEKDDVVARVGIRCYHSDESP